MYVALSVSACSLSNCFFTLDLYVFLSNQINFTSAGPAVPDSRRQALHTAQRSTRRRTQGAESGIESFKVRDDSIINFLLSPRLSIAAMLWLLLCTLQSICQGAAKIRAAEAKAAAKIEYKRLDMIQNAVQSKP